MQTQEVIIKPTLKVILKADAQKLDEIVVTAMGISREKKALGYAVQDVKSDVLTRAANTDLAGALQGKVSGIDITPSSGMPGASSKITIRGSRSFTGDNTPLYVVHLLLTEHMAQTMLIVQSILILTTSKVLIY